MNSLWQTSDPAEIRQLDFYKYLFEDIIELLKQSKLKESDPLEKEIHGEKSNFLDATFLFGVVVHSWGS